MAGVHKCDRCGALGHKSAICRVPNAFSGVCGAGGTFCHMARQCRTASPTRMRANIVAAPPYGPPDPQDHDSSAPLPPGAWPQHQTAFVFHGDELDGGDVGGGVQQWGGRSLGGGETKWGGAVWAAASTRYRFFRRSPALFCVISVHCNFIHCCFRAFGCCSTHPRLGPIPDWDAGSQL